MTNIGSIYFRGHNAIIRKNRSHADLLSLLQKEAVVVEDVDLILSLEGFTPEDDIIDVVSVGEVIVGLIGVGIAAAAINTGRMI